MNPKFKSPPVVERVIGIQFAQLPFFTDAHTGWFWKSYLDDSWTHVIKAPQIQDRFERFGEKKIGVLPSLLQVSSTPTPERSQIVRASDDTMIQIQNTRFLLNWRKKEDQDYQDYKDLYDEFLDLLEKFRSFVLLAGNEALNLNQWEITYINHIHKGELWESVKDWIDLFPGLSLPGRPHNHKQLESMNSDWSLNLKNEAGRLHVKLNHAIAGSPEGPEVISLDLTCRGPVDETKSFQDGLKLGHDTIVNTFVEITSDRAHKHWVMIND